MLLNHSTLYFVSFGVFDFRHRKRLAVDTKDGNDYDGNKNPVHDR